MRPVRDGELHGDLIALLVSRLGVESYLELGIAYSETLVKVWRGSRAEIHAVDVKRPEVMLPGVAYYIGSTRDYLAKVAAPRRYVFDLAFIDADHSAPSVLADLDALLPLMNPDGLILMHDTYPETRADTEPGLCGDAWRVAAGLRETHPDLEAVTLPYHPGLTIVRKRGGPVWA